MAPTNAYIFGSGPDALSLNVRVSENHRLESEVTQQPLENCAPVTDHVVLKPRTLTLIYEQTNVDAYGGGSGAELAQAAWAKCLGYWTTRQPLFVQTFHDSYSNMIIESLTGLHQAPMKGALTFTMQLKQITFVHLQYISVPASQLSGPPKTIISGVTGRPLNQIGASGFSDTPLCDQLRAYFAANPTAAPVNQMASTTIQGGQQQAATVTQAPTGTLGTAVQTIGPAPAPPPSPPGYMNGFGALKGFGAMSGFGAMGSH